jgi:hypothetical protein
MSGRIRLLWVGLLAGVTAAAAIAAPAVLAGITGLPVD